MMLIDTHCHLDAPAFDADREDMVQAACKAGVSCIVVPSVSPHRFEVVRALAHRLPGVVYALGVHPWFVQSEKLVRVSPECAIGSTFERSPLSNDSNTDAPLSGQTDRLKEAIDALALALRLYRDDPRLVAVGEIGLDGGMPGLDAAAQDYLYTEQLKLAREFDLPVLCHVHRAQDQVLKALRRFGIRQGIAHAFNGSMQQAKAFLAQGLKLGFGGQLTYTRAQRVRRLAVELPLDAIVLETDAPDQPPMWCRTVPTEETSVPSLISPRNTPAEVAPIAQILADLRTIEIDQLALCTTANACAALPRLKHFLR
jgi:TatD DNase family protein